MGLHPVTSESITDPQCFIDAVREVRRNGYAVSHGEIIPGFSAVDVPVFSKTGDVELVISSMYVTSQMAMDDLSGLITLLVTTSRKLSEWSGFLAMWS
jgi:DNA-binding IclR family transcriptional regulator